MSEFFSEEARKVLSEDSDPSVLYSNVSDVYDPSSVGGSLYPPTTTASLDLLDPQWALAHTSTNGEPYFHPDPSQAVFAPWDFPTSEASYPPPLQPGILQQPQPSGAGIRRSNSPRATDLDNYGFLNGDQQTWRCAYPGCSSKARFSRACDLRKHFNRHNKTFFCRHDGCPQATEGGFSSKKDRLRHEAKHNPGINCEWEGCERIFSRVDNMKDHVRRIHRKGSQ
ncbi:hypothetical protein MMC25_007422 [Agyrium rufum]|nr:hypothetical protein [Agyrium rufum]